MMSRPSHIRTGIRHASLVQYEVRGSQNSTLLSSGTRPNGNERISLPRKELMNQSCIGIHLLESNDLQPLHHLSLFHSPETKDGEPLHKRNTNKTRGETRPMSYLSESPSRIPSFPSPFLPLSLPVHNDNWKESNTRDHGRPTYVICMYTYPRTLTGVQNCTCHLVGLIRRLTLTLTLVHDHRWRLLLTP